MTTDERELELAREWNRLVDERCKAAAAAYFAGPEGRERRRWMATPYGEKEVRRELRAKMRRVIRAVGAKVFAGLTAAETDRVLRYAAEYHATLDAMQNSRAPLKEGKQLTKARMHALAKKIANDGEPLPRAETRKLLDEAGPDAPQVAALAAEYMERAAERRKAE
jgi:hypothetical protein